MNREFWQTLFDEGELTCFTPTVYGLSVKNAQAGPFSNDNFFCINPLRNSRKDANVTAYRNILCEFDKGSLSEQMNIIKESKIPYTSVVYSGGKSLHMIISLEEPCKNEALYRGLVKLIHAKFPTVDRAASNPSRLSRCPGIIRSSTEERQELWELRGRVDKNELSNWIGPMELPQSQVPILASIDSERPLGLSIFADHFLRWGNVDEHDTYKNNFNNTLLKVAMEMARKGYTKSEATAILMGVCGYLKKESFRTIDSAYRRAHESGT